MKDYTKESLEKNDYAAVLEYAKAAMAAMLAKLEGKVTDLKEPLPEGTPAKELQTRKEALDQAIFKLEQFQETQAAFAQLEQGDSKID